MDRSVIDVRIDGGMRIRTDARETGVINRATLTDTTVIVVADIDAVDCARKCDAACSSVNLHCLGNPSIGIKSDR